VRRGTSFGIPTGILSARGARIMIPAPFGLAIADSGVVGHAVGHNRMVRPHGIPRARGASRTEAVAGFLAGGGLLPVLGDLLADLGR